MLLEIAFWSLVVFIIVFGTAYTILGIGFFVFGIPFIPTSKKVVEKMIILGKLKKSDKVVEIGCGDGRLVFAAAEKSNHVVGYEGVFLVVWFARLRQKWTKKNGEIHCRNFLKEDLSEYDVVFAYLSDEIMKTFYEKKWAELKPGVRIISNTFRLPQEKETPIQKVKVGKYLIYVYVKKK